MKSLKLMTIGMIMLFASSSIQAQVSVNVNIGTQPVWAPEIQSSANYYYIPDVQCYYDVRATQFIYLNNGAWIRSNRLPNHHRNYDLNRGYKVVLNNYHGSRPYTNYRYDKVKYYKGYRGTPHRVASHKVHDNHKRYYANNNNNHKDYKKNNKHNEKRSSGKGNKHHH